MKKLILSILAGTFVCALITSNQSQAEQTRRKHEVLILWCHEGYGHDAQGKIYYSGFTVRNSDSSAGAPRFENGTGQAQAMADALDAGFRIASISDNTLKIVFTK